MANVLKSYDRTLGKVLVEIHKTKSGQDFRFILNKDTVEVVRLPEGVSAVPEWFDALSEQEKLDVFNHILAVHRARSMGDQGFRLAAIGVTQTGRIYIHENSEQLSTDHNRQCAEQNMVVTAENGETDIKISQAIRHGGKPSDVEKTKPEFKAIYLMGGREGDIPIACPCGNCTDLLSRVMAPSAPIWILPANDGTKALHINTQAQMASTLAGDEAWKTTIAHLKRPSFALSEVEQETQVRALHQMAGELSAVLEMAVRDSNKIKQIQRGDKKVKLAEPLPVPELNDPTINAAMRNAHVNACMIGEIKNSVLNRLCGVIQRRIRGREPLPDLSPEGIVGLINQYKIRVDCVVIEMEDGVRYENTITKSALDNAQQPPEVNVVAISNKQHGTDGIERVWGMHFGLHTIRDHVQLTSPNAGVERLVKRRPQRGDDTIHFTFAPFNDGTPEPALLAEMQRNFTGQQLFPGYFTGKASQQKAPAATETPRQSAR
ncbi:MAG: cytidine deaminase [Rickettsiales bacterium]